MKQVHLILFGLLRERFSAAEISVQSDAETVRALLSELFQRTEVVDMADWEKWLRVAREDEYISLDSAVADHDQLALIPPVAGGTMASAVDVGLTGAVLEELPVPVGSDFGRTCGSLLTFLGVVRADSLGDEGEVDEIHYEAHEPMALRKMQQVSETIVAEHGLLGIWIRHRVGVVTVGEAAIVVVVGSVHREEGFDAIASLMNRFKKEVPIFKKELAPDGVGRWVGLEEKTL